ncbi:MAG TPA: tRNA (adenosine(37)-N6)-dimethylallyltransferase MiaA [Gaiellaceae bacterium]|nr:tRNA (adenosine(37)-N6)-dimethylallyltransferase MiaA [Gaiellaceae bacterium]
MEPGEDVVEPRYRRDEQESGERDRRRPDSGDNAAMTVIAIFGPTASGKSAVAEAVAARIPAELVSADAMQVYRDLPILTNQSSHPTRLVGIWPLEHEASVGEYAPLAHAAIDEILAAGRTPVVVGGTGLYLRAALAELALPPGPAPGARARWARLYEEEGPAAAHARLAAVDPFAAAAVHANDRRRVVRALELAEAGASLAPEEDRLWAGAMRHPTLLVGLDVPKDVLERRIRERTCAMFDAGVQDEVRTALARPISSTARKTMGLDEVAALPREEAIAALVVRTRRYAAYQRKWMRRLEGLVMVAADRPPEETADAIVALARARERVPRRRG